MKHGAVSSTDHGGGKGRETWRGRSARRSHLAARRRKNASEPIVLKRGRGGTPTFAVLGAKFLLIDKIEGGDLGSAHRAAELAAPARAGRFLWTLSDTVAHAPLGSRVPRPGDGHLSVC